MKILLTHGEIYEKILRTQLNKSNEYFDVLYYTIRARKQLCYTIQVILTHLITVTLNRDVSVRGAHIIEAKLFYSNALDGFSSL